MLGVMTNAVALSLAQEKELDLVQVSTNVDPPICRLIEYGKFLYNLKKKEQQNKKMTKATEMKGARLSFRMCSGDMDRQRDHAEEFLSSGHPVRVQMVMKGRERNHANLAFEKLNSFLSSLSSVGVVDQPPRISGFQIVAILKPNKAK